MIYVYTSILNAWDNLRTLAVPSDSNVRYVCFTNVPNLPSVWPWEFRPLYPVGEPCRTARAPKILPHLMLPDDAEYSIYLDGNLQLKAQPAQIIVDQLAGHDWAAHQHPCRSCIYDEADCILYHPTMEGWRDQDPGRAVRIFQEVAKYRREGYPEGAGLWANGMIVRRHTAAVAELNESWWRLYAAGGERDQLSFPVAQRSQGLEVKPMPGVISGDSPYVNFFFHAAWKDKEGVREYKPERDRLREKLRQLAAVTGTPGDVRYPEF